MPKTPRAAAGAFATETLTLGLPTLGAAVGGVRGLVGGALGAAVLDGVTRPERGGADRLKTILAGVGIAVAVEAGSALIGRTAPTVAAGLLVTGLAVRETFRRWEAEPVSLDPVSFTNGVLDRLEERLATPLERPGVAIWNTHSTVEERSAQALAGGLMKAAGQLDAQELSLIGEEVGKELAGPYKEQTSEVYCALLGGREPLPHELQKIGSLGFGDEVRVVENKSTAMADGRYLYVDQDFLLQQSPATVSFTLGHEESHNLRQDSDGLLGRRTLSKQCRKAQEQKSETHEFVELSLLARSLEAAEVQLSRRDELSADRRGYQRARSQGFQDHEILEGAKNVLGSAETISSDDPHPPAAERLRELAGNS